MVSFYIKNSFENLFIISKISKIFSWSYSRHSKRESILFNKISILSFWFFRACRDFFICSFTTLLVHLVVFEWWSIWAWRHSEERNCLCLVQKVLVSYLWHLHFKAGPNFYFSFLHYFINMIAFSSLIFFWESQIWQNTSS